MHQISQEIKGHPKMPEIKIELESGEAKPWADAAAAWGRRAWVWITKGLSGTVKCSWGLHGDGATATMGPDETQLLRDFLWTERFKWGNHAEWGNACRDRKYDTETHRQGGLNEKLQLMSWMNSCSNIWKEKFYYFSRTGQRNKSLGAKFSWMGQRKK